MTEGPRNQVIVVCSKVVSDAEDGSRSITSRYNAIR